MMIKFQTKKVISLLLVLVLSFATGISSVNAEYNNPILYVNSDEYRFVKAFDLMPVCNYDDFQPDKHITRAEFARILCALGNIEPTEGGNDFVDISLNEYKGYISAVNNSKMMVGTDKYTFMPDKQITINEAIKTIVVLLGYDVVAVSKGGYPTGYLSVAHSLKLLNGITTPTTSFATKGDITRIIYNARNVEIMDIISVGDYIEYGTDSDKTLLTVYHGIDYANGLMTDNGITALRGTTQGGNGRIKINNTFYMIDDVSSVRDYIGRYVEVYYTYENDNNISEIRYIQLDNAKKESEITFDISDFKKLSDRKLDYEVESDKIKTIKMSNTLSIIYNNKASKTLSEDMFDYDYGTVTYVPADYDNSDVLIIEGFVSWYIQSLDRDTETVRTTAMCEKIDNSYTLNIPEDKIGETIFIEDEHGLSAGIDDITRYSVIDISKNDDVMHIKIAPLVATDKKVNGITRSEDETIIIFDDSEEKVSPYYSTTEDFSTVESGCIYYVYTNSFGDIAALVLVENLSLEAGYLIGADDFGTFGDDGKIKILTKDNKIEIFDVNEKINFSDNLNNTSKLNFSDVISTLQAYDGPVNYKLNENNVVTAIYLPVELNKDREPGRLGIIFEGVPPYRQARNFGTKVLFDKNSNIFTVYESESEDEKRYRCVDISTTSNDIKDVITAYNDEPGSLYADFFSMKIQGATANPKISSTSTLIMISDINAKAFYNDEIYTVVRGSNLGNYKDVTLYISDEDMTAVSTTTTSTETFDLKKGDIILCTLMASDTNIIERARLLWRSDMPNQIDAQKGRKGGIAGNIGYYDSTRSSQSNPYIMYGGGDALSYNTAQHTVWSGYVYYADKNGGIVLSTKDLSFGNIDDDWDDTKHKMATFFPNSGKYSLVSYRGDNIICREGSSSDIRSYMVDGNEASRAIVLMNYAESNRIIIINGEME